jgi:hypothetical protein
VLPRISLEGEEHGRRGQLSTELSG